MSVVNPKVREPLWEVGMCGSQATFVLALRITGDVTKCTRQHELRLARHEVTAVGCVSVRLLRGRRMSTAWTLP